MTKQTKDWSGIAAMVTGGALTGAMYLLTLIVLFGPMAHALTQF